MKDLTPAKSDLDPIEIASIDEIRALQLDRLKWSIGLGLWRIRSGQDIQCQTVDACQPEATGRGYWRGVRSSANPIGRSYRTSPALKTDYQSNESVSDD